MKLLEELITGMRLIMEVEPTTSLRAEHDEIWFGDNPDLYSEYQKSELEKLGWTVDEGVGFHWYV